MGDPRRIKKKYAKPKHPFETERFEQELQLVGPYGLRNKREVWKHKAELSDYRRSARYLLGLPPSDRAKDEKELVDKLIRLGMLKKEPTLENVLDMTLPDVLERRLQTIVFRKGLSCSMYHARQLVTHGHIVLDQARIRTPSRIMSVAEESRIGYAPNSALNDASHPARVAASDAAQRATMTPEAGPEEEMPPRPKRMPRGEAPRREDEGTPDAEQVPEFEQEDERL